MGATLSEPVTAMVVERCRSPTWTAGAVTMQGWRRSHEDAHILCGLDTAGSTAGVFAVLDGHGGQAAAAQGSALLEAALKKIAEQNMSDTAAVEALKGVFIECDASLRAQLEPEGDRSGTTVVAGIVQQPSPNEYCVHLAHAGDSRAVLFSRNKLHCTEDHKPNRADETRRIEAAGGSVSQGPLGGGPMRVDGALAVSRALGDFHFKRAGAAPEECKVSAVPEVQTVPGCVAGDWLFIACDGVFDVMSNEEVRDFVEGRISRDMADAEQTESRRVDKVMAELLQLCLDKGTKDNCTACLIQFGMGAKSSVSQVELLQGKWEQAPAEVQEKYAEFFIAHGFEAEAKQVQACSAAGRRGAGGRPGDGPSQGRAPVGGQPVQQMAALTRALQAIRSTRAIQTAWRARQASGREDDAKPDDKPAR
mmetsp:Transcript_60959/g.108325  ORF Transcript_60959/g.108325 Transcript_60959/m.108325 type:complete len:421 (-) Transcript_60959:162-1424(-)